jgi:hypothetical protein
VARVAGRAGRAAHGRLVVLGEAEFYANVAQLGLRLATSAPGQPPIASAAQLVERLDPSWLTRSWQGHPAELGIIRDVKSRLADVAVRMGNLAAALGSALDGPWAVEDVDLAVFTIPTLANASDGDAAMRMLLGHLAHYATRRKPRQRRALILFDEFSSLEGGRRRAIDLVERARGPHVGVVLAAQSAVALGAEDERARLLAAANAVLTFRTPDQAPLTAMAGTTRAAEAAWQLEQGELSGRETITVRSKARVDTDQVRAAQVGEATLISGGRAERLRIIRTAIPAATAAEARLLVTGLTRPRPAGALAGNPAPTQVPAVRRCGDTAHRRWGTGPRPTTAPRREVRRSSSPSGSGRPGSAKTSGRSRTEAASQQHQCPRRRDRRPGGRTTRGTPHGHHRSSHPGQPRTPPGRPRPRPRTRAGPAPARRHLDRQLPDLRVPPRHRPHPSPGRAAGRRPGLPHLPRRRRRMIIGRDQLLAR